MFAWLRSLLGARLGSKSDPAPHAVQDGSLLATVPHDDFPALKGEQVHIALRVSASDERADRDLGDGRFVITNRRMVFEGGRRISLPYRSAVSAGGDGGRAIVVQMQDGRDFTFRAVNQRAFEMATGILEQIRSRQRKS